MTDGQRHAEYVRKLEAQVKDLKTRLRVAKRWVGDYNGMWIVLDLRVKNWRKKWDAHWEQE